MQITYGIYDFPPTGRLIAARTAAGLCYLGFGDETDLQCRFPRAGIVRDQAGTAALARQAVAAWQGKAPLPSLDLSAGTAFQQQVWRALLDIPTGQTRSYGEIARAIGNPKACRAVGGAVGANPIVPLIPCHRVINADGSIGNYSGGGPEVKRRLLREEGAIF